MNSIRTIKLLIILPSLRRCGPVLGGIALAKYLDKAYCRITIGYLKQHPLAPSAIYRDLIKCGITLKYLKMPNWMDLIKMPLVQKYIKDEQYDIVNSYGLRPDIINALCAGNSISVSSVRGIIGSEYQSKYGRFVSKIFTSLHFYMLSKMESIIAMTEDMRSDLVKGNINDIKIHQISNFIDPLDIPIRHHDFRDPGGDDQPINIGFIGNFIPRKRIHWIIQSFASIKGGNTGKDVRFHLVGDGPLRNKMEQLAFELGLGNSVTFHGYITDVYRILRTMDVVVLASEAEGTPRVFMEAMAMGKSCIGPNIAGVNTLIVDGETGYLFNADNPDDLTQKIRFVVDKDAYISSTTVSEYILNEFGADAGAVKVFMLFQKLIEKKPSAMGSIVAAHPD